MGTGNLRPLKKLKKWPKMKNNQIRLNDRQPSELNLQSSNPNPTTARDVSITIDSDDDQLHTSNSQPTDGINPIRKKINSQHPNSLLELGKTKFIKNKESDLASEDHNRSGNYVSICPLCCILRLPRKSVYIVESLCLRLFQRRY